MTLKYWKKEKTRRGLSKWINDAGQFTYVTSSTGTRGDKVWVVDSNHPQYWSSASYFDNRDKAIAHALDFMKRHDTESAGHIIFSQGVDLRTMRR